MAYRKTLSDLRSAVRLNLDEPSPSFWSNANLTTFINRAKDRVWTDVRKVKDDYFIIRRTSLDGSLTILGESYSASGFAIAAGTTDYTMPHDLVELKLIQVITSGYEHVRFQMADLTDPGFRRAMEVTENTAPNVFYADLVGERTMVIAPKSDTALDLRITYVRKLADLSDDSDELEMPDPLYLAVEAYATSHAMMEDRDPNSTVWELRGQRLVADFVGAIARQTQNPRLVRDFFEAFP